MMWIEPQRPLARLPGEGHVPAAAGSPGEADERLHIPRREGEGLPSASPPMKAARTVLVASVVLPKMSVRRRIHTSS